MTWEQYEYSIGPNGAMFVGNAEEVAKNYKNNRRTGT